MSPFRLTLSWWPTDLAQSLHKAHYQRELVAGQLDGNRHRQVQEAGDEYADSEESKSENTPPS